MIEIQQNLLRVSCLLCSLVFNLLFYPHYKFLNKQVLYKTCYLALLGRSYETLYFLFDNLEVVFVESDFVLLSWKKTKPTLFVFLFQSMLLLLSFKNFNHRLFSPSHEYFFLDTLKNVCNVRYLFELLFVFRLCRQYKVFRVQISHK